MSKQVLIIVGDATETLDTIPVLPLAGSWLHARRRWAGKRLYQMVLHEINLAGQSQKREGYTIKADIAFSDIQPENYAGILFSGEGHRVHPMIDLVRITKHFFETNKPIASVCLS